MSKTVIVILIYHDHKPIDLFSELGLLGLVTDVATHSPFSLPHNNQFWIIYLREEDRRHSFYNSLIHFNHKNHTIFTTDHLVLIAP
jgi:hypothetical protein